MGRNYIPLFFGLEDILVEFTQEQQLAFFWAIFNYGKDGTEPVFDDAICRVAWKAHKPVLDKSIEIGNKRSESGGNGGGQPGNRNASKTSKNEQKRAKATSISIGISKPIVLTDDDIKNLRG